MTDQLQAEADRLHIKANAEPSADKRIALLKRVLTITQEINKQLKA